MTHPKGTIPHNFVVTLFLLATVFIMLAGVLMFLFPPRGPGVSPAQWFAIIGFVAILAFAIIGTLRYQWKARDQQKPPQVATPKTDDPN